ncbi:MAG TPA: YSC84-related protein [Burkholderiales bacterium]|nr:YSC84-related protein [Burkholderiales bacterium]
MIGKSFAVSLAAIVACALLPGWAFAQTAEKTPAQTRQELHKDVESTIAHYKNADPGIGGFFKKSAGYVVFPKVGKAGLIVGFGHGDGELFERGRVVGVASITLGTVGLQAGAQEYSEIVFFENRAALDRFKQNKFEFAASASAVIVKAGAAASEKYRDGVAVFTEPSGGAMVEAAVGSQKFSYKADAKGAKK